MATRTVSAAGGNWNNTATWVGGVVPTTSDDIAADATSGNLTVNVNVSVRFADFTGYTGTLQINSGNTLTLTLSGSTTTFGSGMSYNFVGSGATRGRIVKGNTAMTFTMLGTTPIPHFSNTGVATLTAGSDLYFNNIYNTASGLRIDGNNVYIDQSLESSGRAFAGTTTYHMTGTGTLSGTLGGFSNINNNLIINTTGTITLSAFGFGFANVNSNNTFTHTAGTIVNPEIRASLQLSPSTNTLDLISGVTWSFYQSPNINGNYNLTFVGTPQFDKFILQNNYTTTQTFTIDGVDVTMNELNIQLPLISYTKSSYDFVITPGCDVTVNSFIDLNGGSVDPSSAQTPTLEILSASAGTPAVLNVNSYSQYVSRVSFTDIDCSGGNTLYGQNLTLSNTTNISQYTLPPSGGTSSGGETSHTFFS
jgi:hypothetical protein